MYENILMVDQQLHENVKSVILQIFSHLAMSDDESSLSGSKRGRDDDNPFLGDEDSILTHLGTRPDGNDNMMDEETLRDVVSFMTRQWTKKAVLSTVYKSFSEIAASRFGACKDGATLLEKYRDGSMSQMDLDTCYKIEMFKRIRLEALLRQKGLLENSGVSSEDLSSTGYSNDMARIQENISRSFQLLKAEILMQRALDPSVDAACPTLSDPFGFIPYNESKLNDYESFLVYILRQLYDRNYRRYKESVYKQIMSPPLSTSTGKFKKHATHAYEMVCEIKDFVKSVVSKEDTFQQWHNMLLRSNQESVVKYLSHCNEAEFLPLEPDRHWHSFQNGMYFTESASFFEYGSPEIPANVVSCKYHDLEFDSSMCELEDWTDISTPEIQSIFDHQFSHLTPEVRKEVVMWMYAFFGRLLFEVGEKDSWQIILFIIGRAGTGKSLLLKVVGWFFNDEDVETMANNIQKGFGLETIVDKYMWRCYEVKNDFGLDQAQLQSMVSGENVSIQIKHKPARNVLWKVPGILAGNEAASWIDNSGSITRRIVMVYFDHKVESNEVDPHMDKKIKQNIANLLHKCCVAYLSAVEAHGQRDIWSTYSTGKEDKFVLPLYFHNNKKRLQEMTHVLASFLNNDPSIQLCTHAFGMPMERLKTIANQYFLSNGMGKFGWKPDKFKIVFDDYKLKIMKLDKKYLASKGCDGSTLEYCGTEYGIGTEWVLGITENKGSTDF